MSLWQSEDRQEGLMEPAPLYVGAVTEVYGQEYCSFA